MKMRFPPIPTPLPFTVGKLGIESAHVAVRQRTTWDSCWEKLQHVGARNGTRRRWLQEGVQDCEAGLRRKG